MCLALIAAAGVTEGLAVILLYPLLLAAGVEMDPGAPVLLPTFVGPWLNHFGPSSALLTVLVAYALVVAAQASLSYSQSILSSTIVQEFSQDLRARLYRAIAKADWVTLIRIRSSDFTFALTTGTDAAANAANQLLFASAAAAVAGVYIVLAFRVSSLLAAVVVGAAAILLLFQYRRTIDARQPGHAAVERGMELYATAAEHLGGLKTARTYGHEDRHIEIVLRSSAAVSASKVTMARVYAGLRWGQSVGAVVALGILLFLSVRVLELPTASVLILLFLFSRLVPRLVSLQQAIQSINGELPAFQRITTLIELCKPASRSHSGEQVPILPGTVALSDVSFSYGGDDQARILADLNMVFPSGKTTAIVGQSGAGKTTIADVLLGLLTPQSGGVRVGPATLARENLDSWRQQIGYVAQDSFLFNGTLRANLTWANPEASENLMWDALAQAAADDFVRLLPSGLDTVIGERGVRLSGGEKQRISLARALVREPRVLVLDEATSALDSENEQKVYEAIARLHGAMTIIVISHRLSTIRNADLIHIIDSGRLIESGTWDSLVKSRNKQFLALCAAQGVSL